MHCHHPKHHALCHKEGCKICQCHDDCKRSNKCRCTRGGEVGGHGGHVGDAGDVGERKHVDCPYHGCEACQRHHDCEGREECQHREDDDVVRVCPCPYHDVLEEVEVEVEERTK